MDPEGDAPEPLSSRTFWVHPRPRLFRRGATAKRSKAFQRSSRADHSHLAFLAACYAQLGDTAAATGATRDCCNVRRTSRSSALSQRSTTSMKETASTTVPR